MPLNQDLFSPVASKLWSSKLSIYLDTSSKQGDPENFEILDNDPRLMLGKIKLCI